MERLYRMAQLQTCWDILCLKLIYRALIREEIRWHISIVFIHRGIHMDIIFFWFILLKSISEPCTIYLFFTTTIHHFHDSSLKTLVQYTKEFIYRPKKGDISESRNTSGKCCKKRQHSSVTSYLTLYKKMFQVKVNVLSSIISSFKLKSNKSTPCMLTLGMGTKSKPQLEDKCHLLYEYNTKCFKWNNVLVLNMTNYMYGVENNQSWQSITH